MAKWCLGLKLGQIVLLFLCIAFKFRQAHLRRYRERPIDTRAHRVLKVQSEYTFVAD
jgi:hypothetical protein